MAVREHHIKIAPQYFKAVADGTKRAELRKNDRNYRTGDVLSLAEFAEGAYTGRELAAVVTHILVIADVMPEAGNWVVLSIRVVNTSEARNYIYFGGVL